MQGCNSPGFVISLSPGANKSGGNATTRHCAAGRERDLASAWLALLLAGLLEIGWALGLKYSDGFTRFWPTATTVAAIILSFALMGISLKSLPFGTAYAVWTGIGAAGTMIIGMTAFGEPADAFRISCLVLIILGTAGLKLAGP
jgi:quaternary ammonium compound-resistance protein SugE